MVGWTGRQKLKNPRRLYEFWLYYQQVPEPWSQAKVARVFHVTRQCAWRHIRRGYFYDAVAGRFKGDS